MDNNVIVLHVPFNSSNGVHLDELARIYSAVKEVTQRPVVILPKEIDFEWISPAEVRRILKCEMRKIDGLV